MVFQLCDPNLVITFSTLEGKSPFPNSDAWESLKPNISRPEKLNDNLKVKSSACNLLPKAAEEMTNKKWKSQLILKSKLMLIFCNRYKKENWPARLLFHIQASCWQIPALAKAVWAMVSVMAPCRAHGCLTPAPTPALISPFHLPVSRLFWNAGFNMKVWCCWTHAASCGASHARSYLQFEIHKHPKTPSLQQWGEVHWEQEQQSPYHVKRLCCHHGKRLSCSLHPSQGEMSLY